jgi:hypothetical protein
MAENVVVDACKVTPRRDAGVKPFKAAAKSAAVSAMEESGESSPTARISASPLVLFTRVARSPGM